MMKCWNTRQKVKPLWYCRTHFYQESISHLQVWVNRCQKHPEFKSKFNFGIAACKSFAFIVKVEEFVVRKLQFAFNSQRQCNFSLLRILLKNKFCDEHLSHSIKLQPESDTSCIRHLLIQTASCTWKGKKFPHLTFSIHCFIHLKKGKFLR